MGGIATSTMVKTTPALAREFAAYHRNIGVDLVVMFIDDPSDIETANAVQDIPGVEPILCTAEHWAGLGVSRPETVQGRTRANAEWLLRTRSDVIDWLFMIDQDELLWCPSGLSRAIAEEGRDVSELKIPVLEAVPLRPDSSDPFRGTNLFKVHRPKRYPWAIRLHADTAFTGPKRYFRGHVRGKQAIRLDGTVQTLTLHGAKTHTDDYRFTTSSKIRLLHFDATTFEQWKWKWRNRGEFGSHRKKSRRRQMQRFRRLDHRGDEAGLMRFYRRLYMIPRKEIPVLRALGLLKKIDIDEQQLSW